MRFNSSRSSTNLSGMFHSCSSLDDHCLLLFFLCRLGCSTASALWPATTPSACSVSGRGSASCWHRDTSSPSRSSSGVQQMTTWWWDALTARCTSGRWTQVKTEWLECVFFRSFSLELDKMLKHWQEVKRVMEHSFYAFSNWKITRWYGNVLLESSKTIKSHKLVCIASSACGLKCSKLKFQQISACML